MERSMRCRGGRGVTGRRKQGTGQRGRTDQSSTALPGQLRLRRDSGREEEDELDRQGGDREDRRPGEREQQRLKEGEERYEPEGDEGWRRKRRMRRGEILRRVREEEERDLERALEGGPPRGNIDTGAGEDAGEGGYELLGDVVARVVSGTRWRKPDIEKADLSARFPNSPRTGQVRRRKDSLSLFLSPLPRAVTMGNGSSQRKTNSSLIIIPSYYEV